MVVLVWLLPFVSLFICFYCRMQLCPDFPGLDPAPVCFGGAMARSNEAKRGQAQLKRRRPQLWWEQIPVTIIMQKLPTAKAAISRNIFASARRGGGMGGGGGCWWGRRKRSASVGRTRWKGICFFLSFSSIFVQKKHWCWKTKTKTET